MYRKHSIPFKHIKQKELYDYVSFSNLTESIIVEELALPSYIHVVLQDYKHAHTTFDARLYNTNWLLRFRS